jgi:hypothetical protein
MFPACAGASMSDVPEIRIWLGQDASQLEQYLVMPLLLDRSQMLMLRNPYKAKINLQEGEIEVLIDGTNSATLMTSMIVQRGKIATSEIRSISTDSGDQLLEFDKANSIATQWCSAIANVKGNLPISRPKLVKSPEKCSYENVKKRESSGVEISQSKSLKGDILGYRVILSLGRH